jgi:leucine dehydrogenase
MSAFWTEPDYDDHELVQLVRDKAAGLTAIIAVHSTHLGPGAGGTRVWHYPDPKDAVRDALRLSRGMSYKNAMAGLPMGGGKAVILADENRTKTTAMLHAFAEKVDQLAGKYVTAADVGISEDDIVTMSERTSHVTGLPVDDAGSAGGDPGPFTAMGVFAGIKAAVRHKLGKDSLEGVHIAIQGTGSVGGGVARLAAEEGARLTLADINQKGAQALADEIGAQATMPDAILSTECDVLSPNALGAILNEDSIAALNTPIVAGGANNQLARAYHGEQLAKRGILFAPDYVINAGGIISVAMEYLCRRDGKPCDLSEVQSRIAQIPERLTQIWRKSEESGLPSDVIADNMAKKLIGR